MPLRPVAERPLTWEETSQKVFGVFESQCGAILSTLEQRWSDERSELITEILNVVVDVLDKTAELALGFAGTTRMRIKKAPDTFDIPFRGINADVLIALQRVHGRFLQMPDMVMFSETVNAPGIVKVEAGVEINRFNCFSILLRRLKALIQKDKAGAIISWQGCFSLVKLVQYRGVDAQGLGSLYLESQGLDLCLPR